MLGCIKCSCAAEGVDTLAAQNARALKGKRGGPAAEVLCSIKEGGGTGIIAWKDAKWRRPNRTPNTVAARGSQTSTGVCRIAREKMQDRAEKAATNCYTNDLLVARCLLPIFGKCLVACFGSQFRGRAVLDAASCGIRTRSLFNTVIKHK